MGAKSLSLVKFDWHTSNTVVSSTSDFVLPPSLAFTQKNVNFPPSGRDIRATKLIQSVSARGESERRTRSDFHIPSIFRRRLSLPPSMSTRGPKKDVGRDIETLPGGPTNSIYRHFFSTPYTRKAISLRSLPNRSAFFIPEIDSEGEGRRGRQKLYFFVHAETTFQRDRKRLTRMTTTIPRSLRKHRARKKRAMPLTASSICSMSDEVRESERPLKSPFSISLPR